MQSIVTHTGFSGLNLPQHEQHIMVKHTHTIKVHKAIEILKKKMSVKNKGNMSKCTAKPFNSEGNIR